MSENPKREFQGLWIPKEIWLDHSLSLFEKCLFAEIESLDGPQGCYADNKYLTKFFNVSVRTLQDALKKLKSIGYISGKSFNGRKRILSSHKEKVYEKFRGSAAQDKNIYEKFRASGVQNSSSSPSGDSIEPDSKRKNLFRKEQQAAPKRNRSDSAAASSFAEDLEKLKKNEGWQSNLNGMGINDSQLIQLLKDFSGEELRQAAELFWEKDHLENIHNKIGWLKACIKGRWYEEKEKIKSEMDQRKKENKNKAMQIVLNIEGKLDSQAGVELLDDRIIFYGGEIYKPIFFASPKFNEEINTELKRRGLYNK